MAAPPHVLLVEDSALVTDALRVLFEQTGHRVTVAPGVEAAVAAGCATAVDVMLLDLTLADGHGLRVLRELRARGAPPRVTYALTGRDDPVTRQQCIAEGYAGVLIKPVPLRELLALVGVSLSE